MPDLHDLADAMGLLANKIGGFANSVCQDMASTILKDLTEVTPVDTGTALSNWIVTLDAPALALQFTAYVPSPKGRMKGGVWVHAVDPVATAQANAPQTLQAGLAVIATKLPGQSIFITNSLDYIATLDAGSSSQAPAGFVDRAVILGEQVVKNARLIP